MAETDTPEVPENDDILEISIKKTDIEWATTDEELMDEMASNLYCQESGLWGGRKTEYWSALSETEREEWREKTRQHIAQYKAMSPEWQDEQNRASFRRTLEINEAEYQRLKR